MKDPFEEFSNNEAYETYDDLMWLVRAFEKLADEGSGKACWNLSMIYSPDCIWVSDDLKSRISSSYEKELELLIRAYHLFLQEAAAGNGEAMHMIAIYYQTGTPPAEMNNDKSLEWTLKAVEAGFLFAANDLYSQYTEPGSEFCNEEKATEALKILEDNHLRVVPLARPFPDQS